MPLKIVFPIVRVAAQVVAAKQQTTCKYTTLWHVSVCVRVLVVRYVYLCLLATLARDSREFT